MDSLSWVLGAGTSFVVKNLFGLYTVAFVGWTLKEFSSKEGRVISFPELGSQIAFILVLGKVIASMDDEKVNNMKPSAFPKSHLGAFTIILAPRQDQARTNLGWVYMCGFTPIAYLGVYVAHTYTSDALCVCACAGVHV